LSFQKLKKN